MEKRSIGQSFSAALSGLIWAFKTQPNLLRGFVFGSGALLLGFLLPLSGTEKILIFLTIILFFVAEMLNTTLEALVDLIVEEKHKKAKIAKDVAAGTVLLVSIGTLVIGISIFGPYLMALIKSWFSF